MNVIIDGSYVLHRSMHLPGAMSGPAGRPIGAVQSSLKTLGSIVRHHVPSRLFWVHDKAPHPERLQLYPAYKEKRSRTPEEAEEDRRYREAYCDQKLLLLSLLPRFAAHVIDGPYEGDDSIWYLTDVLSGRGEESVIFTSDRDFLQLLSPLVSVYHMDRGILVNEGNWATVSKWAPPEIVLAKAILGDRSDNVPSPCKGLGPVGLKKLLYEAANCTLPDLQESARKLGGKYAVLEDRNVWQQIMLNVRLIFLGLIGFETEAERMVIDAELARPLQFDLQSLVAILDQYGMEDAARSAAGSSHIFEVLS